MRVKPEEKVIDDRGGDCALLHHLAVGCGALELVRGEESCTALVVDLGEVEARDNPDLAVPVDVHVYNAVLFVVSFLLIEIVVEFGVHLGHLQHASLVSNGGCLQVVFLPLCELLHQSKEYVECVIDFAVEALNLIVFDFIFIL